MFGLQVSQLILIGIGIFIGLMVGSMAFRQKFFKMSSQIAEGWKRQGKDTKEQEQPKQAKIIQQHPCRNCHAKVYDNEPYCWNCGEKQ